ncbi:glucodextranase DOMON-like domain-containing protein [Deinococcus koreensis]|uniref:glucodextranase DOMON-like domain-containing protein n=1 Tax=Deinococcus koreensis TaxID=2054903 RepID=UPI001FAFE206|nr:glucodextranase DOMON-like domain-containing protein [Deinococcus koreensis]
MLSLLTAALLTIPDPAGDARGDGGYLLPQRPALTQDALDLRSFSAQPQGSGMRFTVSFGQLGNPWNAPSGFSAGVTDIFIKTGLGGQTRLDDTGLRVRGPGGWQYHLRITGFGSTLTQVREFQGQTPSAQNQPAQTPAAQTTSAQTPSDQTTPADAPGLRTLAEPDVRVEGTRLVIDAAVPPGTYAYWVTNSVYTPLSRDGLLRPTQTGGPTALKAGQADAPTPVDVLAAPGDTRAFTDRTLAAQGQTRDLSTLILAGTGLLGLLVTLGATLAVWRRTGHR